jgi:perosamine synthetase
VIVLSKLALFGGPAAVKSKTMLEKGQPSYGRDYPILGEEEADAVMQVLKSKRLCSLVGSKVSQFETDFAQYVGTEYAFATNTGTAALQCAVAAAGVKAGDEVIVPAYTFIASATSVVYNNAYPVFVDVDQKTYNLDPDRVQEAITPKTKAVMAVHLYGHPAEMDDLLEICNDRNLILIEDAAQAHGATYNRRKTGSIGHIAAFSFQESKNMQCGEGGIVTTNDRIMALKASRLRLFGEEIVRDKPRDYVSFDLGYNFRMTEMEAAVAGVQLKRLDEMNKIRKEHADVLDKGLARLADVCPPFSDPNVIHVYHMYAPKIAEKSELRRELLIEGLRAEGVPTFAWQQTPLYKQPVFQQILPKKYADVVAPVAEMLCEDVFNIYIHPPKNLTLMNEYITAFEKIDENKDELIKRATEVRLRAPKDWGVPRS